MAEPPLPGPGKRSVSAAPASAPEAPSHARPSSVTVPLSPPGAGVHSCCGPHRPQLAPTVSAELPAWSSSVPHRTAPVRSSQRPTERRTPDRRSETRETADDKTKGGAVARAAPHVAVRAGLCARVVEVLPSQ